MYFSLQGLIFRDEKGWPVNGRDSTWLPMMASFNIGKREIHHDFEGEVFTDL